MKIIVTGAAGFIGSHLAEKLVERGHEVLGLDAFTNYYPPELKKLNARAISRKGVLVKTVDLAEDGLEPFFEDAEIIYHLAAQPGISDHVLLEQYIRNNIVATQRTLEAARQSKRLKGFFNISTSSVYGSVAVGSEDTPPHPISYYGITKLAAENLALMYAHQYDLPVASFRAFSVYGERERPEKLFPRLIGSILEDQEFPFYKGSELHRRSFTYVGDIVEGLSRAIENVDVSVGEIINLGNETSVTTKEAIGVVEEIIGRKARFEKRPPRPGDQKETKAVIEKAKRLLGYTPGTALEEGLRREIEWYKNHILRK